MQQQTKIKQQQTATHQNTNCLGMTDKGIVQKLTEVFHGEVSVFNDWLLVCDPLTIVVRKNMHGGPVCQFRP